jgi:hypothetical protein
LFETLRRELLPPGVNDEEGRPRKKRKKGSTESSSPGSGSAAVGSSSVAASNTASDSSAEATLGSPTSPSTEQTAAAIGAIAGSTGAPTTPPASTQPLKKDTDDVFGDLYSDSGGTPASTFGNGNRDEVAAVRIVFPRRKLPPAPAEAKKDFSARMEELLSAYDGVVPEKYQAFIESCAELFARVTFESSALEQAPADMEVGTID